MYKISKSYSDYPQNLLNIEKPPDSIYLLGNLTVQYRPMISIVGAREVKPWVVEWMENELGPALKNTGVGVVSGGARGVDQVSHSLAIRHQLPTLIVLPSGLDQIYPANLKKWIHQKDVLFLSEYDNEQSMRKHHFYLRNRLVVALTPITLVVQSKEKSGTMISARFAIEQGKIIATLPGFPMDAAFAGNNQLLYDGALMVRDQKDLEVIINSSFCVRESSQPAKE